MNITKIEFDKVSAFANRDIKYQVNPEYFKDFIQFYPDLDGLKKALSERNKFPINREILHTTIAGQYKNTVPSKLQLDNIEALKLENTFTVITAHQPSLFCGTMYYIYKIFSAINLAETLTKETGHKVIPIFINGSEDHDFDEVKGINIFNKRLEWSHDSGGPVGRYSLDGIAELIFEVATILGENDNANKIIEQLNNSLKSAHNYNNFVFNFVNELFKNYGLIVVNMDDPAFKKLFIPIMQDELINQVSISHVKSTQQKLESIGISQQAHARDINLFYMLDGFRERIIKEGDAYIINNSELKFSEAEILAELHSHPERFSPNVIMRPLYEEVIFPNLAYIGGGGELAYWLERKAQFDYFKVFFPVLVRRNSALFITANQSKSINKLSVKIPDLFNDEDSLINTYLNANTDIELNTLEEIESINQAFDKLKTKATAADKTLTDFVEGEKNKVVKQIEQIESRIKRSLKKNEETSLNQLKNLRTKLFPNNGLQERHDNFLQFYSLWGNDFFETLKAELNPLDKNFVIIEEV